ncbi:hypothetical protein [Billgrantia montanilacus]|uniref:hypothetical protein n=1 Tax=Billgrantia montanilacus TaxID=2282305 RepID=UPI0011C0677D|nr:hypothetical protein [Halomonas montanilacus]
MPQELRNPLSPVHYRPEYLDDHKQIKMRGGFMILHDHYYIISETSLRERIEKFKEKLREQYIDMLLVERHQAEEADEEKSLVEFDRLYNGALDMLRENTSASEVERHLRIEAFSELASSTIVTFPRAMMWLACADLLEECKHHDKSWSTLLEFKGLGHDIKTCVEENINLNKSNAKKAYGQLSASRYDNVKESFIRLLSSEAPPEGWKTKGHAASSLSEKVLSEHNNSPYSAIYPLDRKEAETKLNTWLRKGIDADVEKAYVANMSRKTSSR